MSDLQNRFTARAREVMERANQEAQSFNHDYIGTEHVLLGLIAEGSGVAVDVLKNLDAGPRKIRFATEMLIDIAPRIVTQGRLPQTSAVNRVIAHAMEEARELHHNYVGTEHLLLGLLREPEGIAAQALTNLGLKLEQVRQEVLTLVGRGTQSAKNEGLRPHDQRKFAAVFRKAPIFTMNRMATALPGLLFGAGCGLMFNGIAIPGALLIAAGCGVLVGWLTRPAK